MVVFYPTPTIPNFSASPQTAMGLSQLKGRVEQSISDLQLRLQANSLKMNPHKTFVTLIRTQQFLKKLTHFM